ncbi:MAG TPA: DUF1018 domain-containing protein [Planctomycetes bacterium]|nr:DUF1018 domain-containing protein [Planctomycetota bacterium]
MLSKDQIKLIQTAVRAAGLRSKNFDGRYRLLLAQYKRGDGSPVTSCTQLNRSQIEDVLAICESLGWRHPARPERFYRDKAGKSCSTITFGQQRAIKHLASDLFWSPGDINGFVRRMTGGRKKDICGLTARAAYEIIEAMKAILSRKVGMDLSKKNLSQITELYDGGTDAQAAN